MPKFWEDALERILWTAASAGVSASGVYVTNLPEIWIPLGTVVLTTVKTLIAGQIGDKSSAALLPKSSSTPTELVQ